MKVAPTFSSSSLVPLPHVTPQVLAPALAPIWQSDSGSTFFLATVRQVQLRYGHLHSSDDIPSGIAQRAVDVENYQPFVHRFSSSLSYDNPFALGRKSILLPYEFIL